MKKFFISLLLTCVFLNSICAKEKSDSPKQEKEYTVRDYQLLNGLAGFGIGSAKQGDKTTANWLLASDITGLSLILGGTTAVIISDVVYQGLRIMYGEVTPADVWISSSVLALGCGIFLAGRIAGVVIPPKYESKKVEAVPVAFIGEKSFTAGVAIKF